MIWRRLAIHIFFSDVGFRISYPSDIIRMRFSSILSPWIQTLSEKLLQPLNHTPVPLPQKVRLDPSMGSPLGRPRQVYNSLCSAFEKGQKWQNILELLSGSGKRSAKGQEMPRTGEENATDKRRKHYVIMSGNVRYESWWSMIRLV